MTLLRWPTDPPQGLSPVPLDLPLGDRPGLADQPSSQPARVDLVPQRRRRHPEPGCCLAESEHLFGFDDVLAALVANGPSAIHVELVRAVVVLGLLADRGLAESRPLRAIADSHLVPLGGGAVHVSNVDGIAYVVKPEVIHNPREVA
jgi:hypothetical protein